MTTAASWPTFGAAWRSRLRVENPARRPELYQYLEAEIAPALRALDYAVTIHDNPDPAGGPFLIGGGSRTRTR